MKRNVTILKVLALLLTLRKFQKKNGLVQLQKQLLAQILGERNIDIWDFYDGADMIKSRLCHKKVLLVLDNVNQLDQLEMLAGDPCWFGLGSWIIITTRDEHLLTQHGVHNIYKPKTLNDHDALKLFCLKVFKNVQPREDYIQLSQDVLYYANGLPLALVTLGSFLIGRTMEEWQSALKKLKNNPERKIFDTLIVSYDGLEETSKQIFLDIACFFRGEMKDRVIEILENCGFATEIGIRDLIDKSLLTIENNKLWMHDLLQDMGWQIVRRESREEPGERSRLWLRKDLFHVLMKKTVRTVAKPAFYFRDSYFFISYILKTVAKLAKHNMIVKFIYKFELIFLYFSQFENNCYKFDFFFLDFVYHSFIFSSLGCMSIYLEKNFIFQTSFIGLIFIIIFF